MSRMTPEEQKIKWREYYQRNRDKRIEFARKYRDWNKEKLVVKSKIYREKNKGRLTIERKKWAEENPMRTKHFKQAAYARTKLDDGTMNVDLVQRVYEENIKKFGSLTCVVCLGKIVFGDDTLEHNMPLCRGGTHDFDNLGIAHLSCNSSKHDKTLKEFNNNVT